MREADSSIRFRHWLRKHHKKFLSCGLEMKDSRGKDYISWTEIKDEQVAHGLANKSDKGNLIRVASGTTGAPDYIFLRNSPSYFVIAYPKETHIIDVETLELERKTSKRKSLTAKRAQSIAVYSY